MVTLHLGPVKVTLSFILSQIPCSPITIFEVQIWAVIFNQNILQILDLQQRFFGQGVEKNCNMNFRKWEEFKGHLKLFQNSSVLVAPPVPEESGGGWCFINLYLLFHKCAILMYAFQHLARVKVFLPMYPSWRHNMPWSARNFPIFPK